MLVVQIRQLLELKLLRECPEELLNWELVHSTVCVAHSDVVVRVETYIMKGR